MAEQLQQPDRQLPKSVEQHNSVEEQECASQSKGHKLVESKEDGVINGMAAPNPAETSASCTSADNSEANNSSAVNNTEENISVNNKASNTSVNNSTKKNSKAITEKSSNNSIRSRAGRNRDMPLKILNTNKITGTVKWFNVRDGYGFIRRNDNGEDVFVHRTAILRISAKRVLRSLGDGEVVEFDIVEVEKGNEAANVTGPGGKDVRGSPFVAEHDVRYRSRYWRGYEGNRREPRRGFRRRDGNDGLKRRGRSGSRDNYGGEDDRRASSRSRGRRYGNNQRTADRRNAPNSRQWRDGERDFSPAYNRNRRGRSQGFRNEGHYRDLPSPRNARRANRNRRSGMRIALPRNNDAGPKCKAVVEEVCV